MYKPWVVISAVLGYAAISANGVSVTEKADTLMSRMVDSINKDGSKYFSPQGFNFSDDTSIVTATPLPGLTVTGLKRSGEATLKLEDFDYFYIHIPFTFANISTFYYVNITFIHNKELSYSAKVEVISNSIKEGNMRIEMDDLRCKGLLMDLDLGGIMTQSYRTNDGVEERYSNNQITTSLGSEHTIDYAADMHRAIFGLVSQTTFDVLDGLYTCDITV